MLRVPVQKVVPACRVVWPLTTTCRSCYTSNSNEDESLRGASPVLTGDRGVNMVTLVGRLGQNPDVRGTVENPVTLLSLATSMNLKTQAGNYVQKTEWHRISIFRPVLRDYVANTFCKGDRVFVTGKLTYSQYTPPGENSPVRLTSIIADDVINLTGLKHSQPKQEQTGASD